MMRKAIPSELRVAQTLWFSATNADYWNIGHLFGASKSTVYVVTKDVCAAIVRKLLPKYIRIPTADGLKDVVEGFKHNGDFLSVLELWMVHIYQLFHQKSALLTTSTTRDGTPSLGRV